MTSFEEELGKVMVEDELRRKEGREKKSPNHFSKKEWGKRKRKVRQVRLSRRRNRR